MCTFIIRFQVIYFNKYMHLDENSFPLVIIIHVLYLYIRMILLFLQVLCKWVLSVRKNYRPVKYHNWRHALNVAQTMFAMLKTGKMERFMSDLEVSDCAKFD